MEIWIVLQPDNDILGVFETLSQAKRCAKARENFWGWAELWRIGSHKAMIDRVDDYTLLDKG